MDWLSQRYSNNLENNGSSIGLFMQKTSNIPIFHSYTVEDEGRTIKVPGETRIWAGIYELKILKVDNDWVLKHRLKYNLNGDNWFKYPIEITKVPQFTGVLVHVGYGEKDTEACVLLADTIGNNIIDKGNIASRSMEAVKRFYSICYPYLESGQKSFIEIRDENFLISK